MWINETTFLTKKKCIPSKAHKIFLSRIVLSTCLFHLFSLVRIVFLDFDALLFVSILFFSHKYVSFLYFSFIVGNSLNILL